MPGARFPGTARLWRSAHQFPRRPLLVRVPSLQRLLFQSRDCPAILIEQLHHHHPSRAFGASRACHGRRINRHLPAGRDGNTHEELASTSASGPNSASDARSPGFSSGRATVTLPG